jgi:hypothetical protein
VAFPGWFIFRSAIHETIHTQVPQGLLARAKDPVQGMRRDAHHVSGLHGMALIRLTDLQRAGPFEHVKDLLRVVMDVQRRRFAGLQHNDKDLRGLCFGAIYDQVIDVRRKTIVDHLLRAKNIPGFTHAISYRIPFFSGLNTLLILSPRIRGRA